MTESPEEFRARMRSIGFMPNGRTKNKVRTIAHPETGERAKETTDELGTVITETANRQDVNIHPETYVSELTAGILDGLHKIGLVYQLFSRAADGRCPDWRLVDFDHSSEHEYFAADVRERHRRIVASSVPDDYAGMG